MPNRRVSGSFNLLILTSLLPTFSLAPSIMPAEWQASTISAKQVFLGIHSTNILMVASTELIT
jgi:hypothetical protein